MKKIFIYSMLLSIFTLITPAFAVCSVTGGACSNFQTESIQDRLVPNRLENLQRTDAFQPKADLPYNPQMTQFESSVKPNSSNYNSNCQFGICLPQRQGE